MPLSHIMFSNLRPNDQADSCEDQEEVGERAFLLPTQNWLGRAAISTGKSSAGNLIQTPKSVAKFLHLKTPSHITTTTSSSPLQDSHHHDERFSILSSPCGDPGEDFKICPYSRRYWFFDDGDRSIPWDSLPNVRKATAGGDEHL